MFGSSRPQADSTASTANDASAMRALSVIGMTGLAGGAAFVVLASKGPMTALPANLSAPWLLAIYTGLQSFLWISWAVVCRFAVAAEPEQHQRQRVLLTLQAAIVIALGFLALQAASRTYWTGLAVFVGFAHG